MSLTEEQFKEATRNDLEQEKFGIDRSGSVFVKVKNPDGSDIGGNVANKQEVTNQFLQSMSRTLTPLHRLNFNTVDQLKVQMDTNSSVLAYNYSYVSPSNADLQYNLPIHARASRFIARQQFIF